MVTIAEAAGALGISVRTIEGLVKSLTTDETAIIDKKRYVSIEAIKALRSKSARPIPASSHAQDTAAPQRAEKVKLHTRPQLPTPRRLRTIERSQLRNGQEVNRAKLRIHYELIQRVETLEAQNPILLRTIERLATVETRQTEFEIELRNVMETCAALDQRISADADAAKEFYRRTTGHLAWLEKTMQAPTAPPATVKTKTYDSFSAAANTLHRAFTRNNPRG